MSTKKEQEKEEKERKQQLEEAKTKKANCESAITQLQDTLRKNNDNLARLRTAKSQMETRESLVWGKYISFKNYFQNTANYGTWNGNKQTETQTYLLDTIAPKYNTYKSSITVLIEEITRKISQLESDNMRLTYSIVAKTTEMNQLTFQICALTQGE